MQTSLKTFFFCNAKIKSLKKLMGTDFLFTFTSHPHSLSFILMRRSSRSGTENGKLVEHVGCGEKLTCYDLKRW